MLTVEKHTHGHRQNCPMCNWKTVRTFEIAEWDDDTPICAMCFGQWVEETLLIRDEQQDGNPWVEASHEQHDHEAKCPGCSHRSATLYSLPSWEFKNCADCFATALHTEQYKLKQK